MTLINKRKNYILLNKLLFIDKNSKTNFNGIQRLASIIDQQYQKIFLPNGPANYYSQSQHKVESPIVPLQILPSQNQHQENFDSIKSSNVRVSAQDLDSNRFRLASSPELAKLQVPNVGNRLIIAETDQTQNSKFITELKQK